MAAMSASNASAPPAAPAFAQGTLGPQILERPLRPGEVSLDELERAFRETAIEVAPPPAPAAQPAPRAAAPKPAKPVVKKAIAEAEISDGDKVANQSIRADAHLSAMPIIALSSMVSPAAIERGRLAGFHDYVAKFDRPGLIAALKEQTAELHRAA